MAPTPAGPPRGGTTAALEMPILGTSDPGRRRSCRPAFAGRATGKRPAGRLTKKMEKPLGSPARVFALSCGQWTGGPANEPTRIVLPERGRSDLAVMYENRVLHRAPLTQGDSSHVPPLHRTSWQPTQRAASHLRSPRRPAINVARRTVRTNQFNESSGGLWFRQRHLGQRLLGGRLDTRGHLHDPRHRRPAAQQRRW